MPSKQPRHPTLWQEIQTTWARSSRALLRLKQTPQGTLIVLWGVAYLVLLGFFFQSVLSNYNYLEVFPAQLIFPAAMHAVTAFVIALIFFRMKWLGTLLAKMVSTLGLTFFMVDYDGNLQAISGVVRALIPGLTGTDMAVVSLVYFIILVVVTTLLGVSFAKWAARFEQIKNRDLQLGLGILALYMFIVPAVGLARMLPTMIAESNTQASTFAKPQGQTDPDRPDVYYIVLDRYTNNTVLDKQFNFDNSNFTDFLKDKGYTVNEDAKSHYPYTAISISSTMSADYTNQFVQPFKDSQPQSRTLYHNLIWQSPVIKAMQQAGYKYHNIGSTYGATYKAPLAQIDQMWQYDLNILGWHKRLRTIEAIAFEQSPYSQFSRLSPGWPIKFTAKNDTQYLNEQLDELDKLSTTQKQGGRLIFAHMLIPHQPYYFNADGSLSTRPEADNVGKPIKDKYIGQIIYINSQIQKLVEQIHKNSGGKAIVILNSDEGPYPQDLNSTAREPKPKASATDTSVLSGDMRDWPDEWLQMKFGILQAVNIPKATDDDLRHLSSVNALRIVLNRYFGYDLEYREPCHFGLTAGSRDEYLYADITRRLREDTDPACRELQSVQTP